MLEAGYAPQVAEDGLTGYHLAKTNPFDLILLDVMLPGLTGFEVCRRLRGDGISTPILILTAKDLLDDKVMGLDSGADDYLVKPFQIAELLARARALLRRLKVGDLSLEPTSRQIVRGGKAISLSATEYALLEYLMRNAGRVLTRAMILQHVWQYDFDGNDKVLDVYISYLRRKIDRGHQNSLIQTVRGVGYCMENQDA